MQTIGTEANIQAGARQAQTKQTGRAGMRRGAAGGVLALGLAGVLAGCTGQTATQPVATSGKPDNIYQASGNEPSWNMTLAQNMLTLETPDGPRMAGTVLHAHADGRTRTYETKDVQVEITAKACSDSMSGQTYAETVRIVTQGRTLNGCGGGPLAPTSLNGTRWVVTALDGHRLADGNKAPSDTNRTTDEPGLNASASDMPPTLDINDSGKVSGSDGCNRYVGGMEFGKNGRVKTAPQGGLSTMMACPGRRDALAHQFFTLTRAVTHWRTDGAALVLETDDKKTVQLRQVF